MMFSLWSELLFLRGICKERVGMSLLIHVKCPPRNPDILTKKEEGFRKGNWFSNLKGKEVHLFKLWENRSIKLPVSLFTREVKVILMSIWKYSYSTDMPNKHFAEFSLIYRETNGQIFLTKSITHYCTKTFSVLIRNATLYYASLSVHKICYTLWQPNCLHHPAAISGMKEFVKMYVNATWMQVPSCSYFKWSHVYTAFLPHVYLFFVYLYTLLWCHTLFILPFTTSSSGRWRNRPTWALSWWSCYWMPPFPNEGALQ